MSTEKPHILITGGSGLIGRTLTELLLQEKYRVSWLSQGSPAPPHGVEVYRWNIKEQQIDEDVKKFSHIIHLAGAGVADKRWTASYKKQILESRTESTRLLVDFFMTRKLELDYVICASAVGLYASGDDLHTETTHKVGTDFLARVTDMWEKEIERFEKVSDKLSIIRIGVVLAKNGGALEPMKKAPIQSPLGSGKQYLSWIHIDDLVQMFSFLLHNKVEGVYNGVSPAPTQQGIFAKTLAKKVRKPYLPLGVPTTALRLIMGEMQTIVTNSPRVYPESMLNKGFDFKYPTLEKVLEEGNLI